MEMVRVIFYFVLPALLLSCGGSNNSSGNSSSTPVAATMVRGEVYGGIATACDTVAVLFGDERITSVPLRDGAFAVALPSLPGEHLLADFTMRGATVTPAGVKSVRAKFIAMDAGREYDLQCFGDNISAEYVYVDRDTHIAGYGTKDADLKTGWNSIVYRFDTQARVWNIAAEPVPDELKWATLSFEEYDEEAWTEEESPETAPTLFDGTVRGTTANKTVRAFVDEPYGGFPEIGKAQVVDDRFSFTLSAPPENTLIDWYYVVLTLRNFDSSKVTSTPEDLKVVEANFETDDAYQRRFYTADTNTLVCFYYVNRDAVITGSHAFSFEETHVYNIHLKKGWNAVIGKKAGYERTFEAVTLPDNLELR